MRFAMRMIAITLGAVLLALIGVHFPDWAKPGHELGPSPQPSQPVCTDCY
jgi:hypothetical protein